MSIFQRIAIAGVVAAGIAGFAGGAEAQYYYQQNPYGYRQQPAPQYVSPKILRKQRELEQRVYQKYGYQQQYQQPRYRQAYPQQQYQQPRYRQAYPQQYYQQPQYQVAPRYVNPNAHLHSGGRLFAD